MTLSLLSADWWWVPAVLAAAGAQTARNVAQRTVGRGVGVLAGTCARFVFGLPLAAAIVLLLHLGSPAGMAVPRFDVPSSLWLGIGALSQLLGSAALVAAMRRQTFANAITCGKTEVLHAALFGAVLLGDFPHWAALAGMGVALTGIWMLSRGAPQGPSGNVSFAGIAFGIAAGIGFGLAAVAFRTSGVLLSETSSVLATSAWCVLLAQLFQSILLAGWLMWRQPAVLGVLAKTWRASLIAGACGVLASVAWFIAFTLRPAADVMALGMVEVVFGYMVTRHILREPMRPSEGAGVALVCAGAAVVCMLQF